MRMNFGWMMGLEAALRRCPGDWDGQSRVVERRDEAVRSDRADRGSGADIDHPDPAVCLGEVGLFTLDHCPGE
ncbi:MAG: hypothetical protein RLZZ522_294 [Verrucomicrobiota bacterium]